jgi:Flp pilus assembly protein TadG
MIRSLAARLATMRRARRKSGFLRSERGAAAVEFAFVVPAVLLLLVGTVEFGRMLAVRNELQYAAEQAARYVIVTQDATDEVLRQKAKAYASSFPPAEMTVTVNRATVSGIDYVTISTSANFPFLSFLDLSAVPLSGSTRVPLIKIN